MHPPEGPPVCTALNALERHAHGHLDQAGVLHFADQGEDLGSLAPFGAEGGEPIGALEDDLRDIGPGFDVVQQRRFSVQPALDGVDVFRPRLAHAAFQRGHQGGRFSADEGPAAAVQADVEIEAAAEDVLAEESQFSGLADGKGQVLDRQGVLVADVDVSLGGADRVTAEDHAFDHGVRGAFHERAVHERARVSLVAVGDDILGPARCVAGRTPLAPGEEPAAASAAQAGAADLLEHFLRLHRRQRLGQRGVSARRQILLDFRRIKLPVVGQHDPLLGVVEGYLFAPRGDFARLLIPVQEPFHHTTGDGRLAPNLGNVFLLDALVEHAARINHHDGSPLAETVAAGTLRLHDQRLLAELFGRLTETLVDLRRPFGHAARTQADPHAVRDSALLGKRSAAEFFEILRAWESCQHGAHFASSPRFLRSLFFVLFFPSPPAGWSAAAVLRSSFTAESGVNWP